MHHASKSRKGIPRAMPMRWSAIVQAGVLAASCTGCATIGLGPDADGCISDNCRQEVAERKTAEAENARRQAQQDEEEKRRQLCELAERDPHASFEYTKQCMAARWTASRILCLGNRVSDRWVQVTCELPASSGSPDFLTGVEKSWQAVAFAALGAGKTHFIFAGEDPVDGRFEDSSTPVHCEQQNRGLYTLGMMARAAGGLAPAATTTCRPGFGGSLICDTQVNQQPPMPQPQFQCSGGEHTSRLVSVTVRQRYELLTENEAAARTDPNLPLARRPMSARELAQLYAGLR